MSNNSIIVNGESIQLNPFNKRVDNLEMKNINLPHNFDIPARTAKFLYFPTKGYIKGIKLLEPVASENAAISPSIFDKNEEYMKVLIVNFNGKRLKLRRGFRLGVLIDADELSQENVTVTDQTSNSPKVCRISVDSVPNTEQALTSEHFAELKGSLQEHVQDLFERSSSKLSFHEAIRVRNLLDEFSDTFSKNDTDIGHFEGIQHKINLTTDKVVKEKTATNSIPLSA